MNYQSIKKEAELCRKACKDSKIGDMMYFIHHGEAAEILTEPIKNRIDYILENKPVDERAIRLHWLRPCPFELAAGLKAAYAKWEAADAKRKAACKKYKNKINSQIKKYFPDCPWNGKTLFSGKEEK